MDKITAFIMTHPDVTIEIKKSADIYQSIEIKMRKNNTTNRKIIGEDGVTELESILAYMYDAVSSEEMKIRTLVTVRCPDCNRKLMEYIREHDQDPENWQSLTCDKCGKFFPRWDKAKIIEEQYEV